MAISPVFFIGYIALGARIGSSMESPIPGDPEGFVDRLEAHVPFVLAANQLQECEPTHKEKHGELLRRVVVEASKGLPTVESTKVGATAATDLRRPIAEAQRHAFEAILHEVHSNAHAGRHWDATESALSALIVTRILRYADSASIARSTAQQGSATNAIRRSLPHLSADELERISNRLIAFEVKRQEVNQIFKNEMHLLTLESRYWPESIDRVSALEVVADALRTFRRGGNFVDHIERSSKLRISPAREAIWTTLSAWEIALRSEDQSQRLLRNLIVETRSRQLAMRGERFDTLSALRLPLWIAEDTIARNRPELVEQTGFAHLHFTPASAAEVVAAR